MKKLALVLVLSLMLSAQGLNAHFGLNLSVAGSADGITGLPTIPTDRESNFAIGLGYDLDLVVVYLSTGVTYSTSTFFGPYDGATPVLAEIKFNQLEVPIMLKAHLFPWVIKPYVIGGLMYQQVLSSNYTPVAGTEQDGADIFKSSFTPIVIGVGLDVDLEIIPVLFTEIRVITSKDYDKNSEFGSFNQLEIIAGIRF
ncbi:MAG: hypothetical protein KDD94_03680 [Calditrichaeota bacterium]|nr:hypothetical protein [Calditrichota bacterium]